MLVINMSMAQSPYSSYPGFGGERGERLKQLTQLWWKGNVQVRATYSVYSGGTQRRGSALGWSEKALHRKTN